MYPNLLLGVVSPSFQCISLVADPHSHDTHNKAQHASPVPGTR